MTTKRFWRRTMALLVFGSAALAAGQALAGSWPASVTEVHDKSGSTVKVSGDLATGNIMDLGFAAKSSMACFPATENVNFEGKHVLFGASLPAQSIMTVTVVPDDPKLDLSVYAYTISSTDFTSLPPTVSSAVSCEAGYDAQHDSNPGASESVKLTAVTHPYNVVIGVAGVKGTKTGTFKLKVEVKPR